MNTREKILHKLKTTSTGTTCPLPGPFVFNQNQSLPDLFKTTAGQNGIQVYEADSLEAIPEQVASICPGLLETDKICITPELSALPWDLIEGRFVFGTNDGTALTGISRADAAVAQTGALVFVNRQSNPAANNFLPRDHVIIVNRSDIRETLCDALLPDRQTNAVNLIAGPSSTADIAGHMLVGVHGPARVICVIVND